MTADWRAALVGDIRTCIHAAEPAVEEEAKWRKASNPDGVPTFSYAGLLCTVETYKEKVKVTFAKGASLPDPTGMFVPAEVGTRRAVDLFGADDLDDDAFTAIAKAAVALNRG